MSSIAPTTPTSQGHDMYRCFLHFSHEVAPHPESRYLLGNLLLDKLAAWKFWMTRKPRMMVTLTTPKGHVLYTVTNMDLFPLCPKRAFWRSAVNQTIADILADKCIHVGLVYHPARLATIDSHCVVTTMNTVFCSTTNYEQSHLLHVRHVLIACTRSINHTLLNTGLFYYTL